MMTALILLAGFSTISTLFVVGAAVAAKRSTPEFDASGAFTPVNVAPSNNMPHTGALVPVGSH